MRIVAAVLLLVLLSACGPTKIVKRTQKVGSQKLIENLKSTAPDASTGPEATPKETARFAGPLFVLQLKDKNGLHPQGIQVQVYGPTNGVFLSDASGEVKLFKTGTYHFQVLTGCGSSAEVFSGGQATAGVVDGRTQRGVLAVDWRHRMSPAPPVFSNPQPPWAIGKDVTVQFNVIDRCTQHFAPNAPYPTFAFGTSSNLRLVKPPVLKSNDKDQGFVTVRCLKAGSVTLNAYDKANPKDVFNIARESSDYAPPSCRS